MPSRSDKQVPLRGWRERQSEHRRGIDPSGPALHVSVLLFGVAGLFGKWIALHPVLIVFARAVVAAGALAMWMRLRGTRSGAPATGITPAFWLGGVLLALHWFAFFRSIQLSSVAVGLLSYSTAPVFAVLLEPLLEQQRLRPRLLVCALLTVIGVALLIPAGLRPSEFLREAAVQGVIWGVCAGLSFALLALLNRTLVRGHGAVRVAMVEDGTAALLLLPLLPWVWSPVSAQDLALLVILGLVCTALAHVLFIYALAAQSAGVATVVSALEPVYGILLARLMLGELITPRIVAGGALILLAVLWVGRPVQPAVAEPS